MIIFDFVRGEVCQDPPRSCGVWCAIVVYVRRAIVVFGPFSWWPIAFEEMRVIKRVSPIMSCISWSEELFTPASQLEARTVTQIVSKQCLARRWRVVQVETGPGVSFFVLSWKE